MIALLFLVAYLLNKNITYLILLVAAALNIIIYPFTSEYSVVIEASLDTFTLLAILFIGDKHKLYQSSLLFFALLCHLQFELDQANTTDLIFSHYATVFIGITIMQLLGAVYGSSNRIPKFLWKGDSDGHLYANSYRVNGDKVWPKD